MKINYWIVAALIVLIPVMTHASPELSINEVHDWSVAAMTKWQTPGRFKTVAAQETREEGIARYQEIAKDAHSVVFDPNQPPLFKGPRGRSKTLALLLSSAAAESSYRKDVDFGHAQGDGGQSWCLMQIKLSRMDSSTGKTQKRFVLKGDSFDYAMDGQSGWGGEDLVRDRTKCFRAGLVVMRNAMIACSAYPVQYRLGCYIAGPRDPEPAFKKSEFRVNRAAVWFSKHPPVADDSTILGLVGQPFGG